MAFEQLMAEATAKREKKEDKEKKEKKHRFSRMHGEPATAEEKPSH